ncbi:MAG: glycoside hydrolase family 3 C-terminal domain-containing protein [Fibrobacterales bacterium]
MKQLSLTIMLATIITLFFPETGVAKTLDDQINELVEQMDLGARVEQLTNNGNMTTGRDDTWGIPGFTMNDGPHGVRADELPWIESSTSFPLAIGMAATWDRALWFDIGNAMGEEFHGYNVNVQLGPVIDLAHNPQNGRAAETASEDPFLAGEYGIAITRGIQSNPVMATIKHYSAVNRQNYRHESDIKMHEQDMLDHFGYHYRRSIQEGGALAIMSSYNSVNNVHASHNGLLINDILKSRWGYPFFVMSDWWSIHDTREAINAGNDLCMGSPHFRDNLYSLVNSNQVSWETLNSSVHRVIKAKMLAGLFDEGFPEGDPTQPNSKEHQELALLADQKAMILLKNTDNILPLPKNKKIALIGPSVDVPRNNISGSGYVFAPYTVTPLQGITDIIGEENVTFAKGVDIYQGNTDGFDEAKNIAKDADYVVYIGGLSEDIEGEKGDVWAGDRHTEYYDLPEKQRWLINELAEVNKNIIVITLSGGIVGVNDFVDNIKGLFHMFYTGQEGGNAIASVLFGDYNPAGRMPVSMPTTEDQMPAWDDDFTNDFHDGYRWYDETGKALQYAFGHGLSYTTFSYDNLTISPASPSIGDSVHVTFDVTNTGDLDGEEVVQLYLSNHGSAVWHPKKELKHFKRIAIASGETKQVTLSLDAETFYYYDMAKKHYAIETTDYDIHVGGASDALPLTQKISIQSSGDKSDLRPVTLYTYPRFPKEGESVQFLATVKNYGTAPTKSANITVKWNINNETVALAPVFDGDILPGQMRLISSDPDLVSQPWTYSASPSLAITVIVDSEEKEAEFDEENNTRTYLLPKPGYYEPEVFIPESSSEEVSSEEPESSSHNSSAIDVSSSDESSSIHEVESSDSEPEESLSSSDEDTSPVMSTTPSLSWSTEINNNILSISLGAPVPLGTITIYSIHGVKHTSISIVQHSAIDITSLPKGAYLIALTSGTEEHSRVVSK